jgi:hypothetical protein
MDQREIAEKSWLRLALFFIAETLQTRFGAPRTLCVPMWLLLAGDRMSEPTDNLELVDLGDATVETKQWGLWPMCLDSIFLLAEWPD